MKTRRSMVLGIGIGLAVGVIIGLILLMVRPLCTDSPCEDAARAGNAVIVSLTQIAEAKTHSNNLRQFGLVTELRENKEEIERIDARLVGEVDEYVKAARRCSSTAGGINK